MKKISLIVVFALLLTSMAFLVGCKSETNTTNSTTDSSANDEPREKDESKEESKEEPKVSDEKSTEEETDASSAPGAVKPNDAADKTNNKGDNELPNPIVTIEMENGGKIVVELYPEYAPNTVNNFVKLVQEGFYDGVVFHRIVTDFVIQGGDPTGTGMGGPGYGIFGEFINNGFAENKLSHTRGVISMARAQSMDSGGSQFFIVLTDENGKHLDKDYAGFGIVTEGMEVVDEIAAVTTDSNDMPVKPVTMKTVTVDTQGVEEWPAPDTL